MKVLITAGPTYEPIDPVRFIGNHSSGKMGIAIAEEFARLGNQVTLVKGATNLNPVNADIEQVKVQTAAEMFAACKQYFAPADVIVFAAAVADYTPKHPSETKIKKKEDEFSIELVKTTDIALELGKQRSDKQVVVGFALETNNEEAHAREKLEKKNLDFIVLNSMRDEGAGFKTDTNKITIIDRQGNVTKFDLKEKTEVAKDIVSSRFKNTAVKMNYTPLIKIQPAKVLLALLLVIGSMATYAQGELKCQLTVNAQKISGVDPSVFQSMQTALSEFMNNKSWTTDQFGTEERIECSMFVNIESSSGQDVYNASITVQLSRPVYNSSYSSPMFNFIDKDCIITYAQNQPLDFNVNQYQSNLTSILGFYAYTLIGLDYETMAKGGGSKYFTMAEQIMNNVPTNAPDSKGWRPFDSQRNRYWLINNLQASKYELFRQALYEYHFLGMDNFYEKPALARQNILNAIIKLHKIATDNPNNMLLAVFFQAKSDEVVNVFSGADMGEKAKALVELRAADPSNATKYDKLVKN